MSSPLKARSAAPAVDVGAVGRRSNEILDRLRAGIETLLAREGECATPSGYREGGRAEPDQLSLFPGPEPVSLREEIDDEVQSDTESGRCPSDAATEAFG